MATRKPDAEVGPIGVWAYNARTSFKDEAGRELQPQEVAPLLPSRPNPATIRKIESNPNYHPEDMVRELFAYYRMLGEQRGIYIPQPPLGQASAPTGDLATAIVALTKELEAARMERASSEARLRYLEGAVGILARAAGVALPRRPVPDGTKG